MNKVFDIVKSTILDKLNEAIKNNEPFQWVKPWNGMTFPYNFVSKKRYNGINLVTLPFGGYYMTFNQIKDKKGKIRKGSKGFPVFFWKFNEVEDEENPDEVKTVPIFRYYKVFHQSDIEGIDFDVDINEFEEDEILEANNVIDKYSSICPILYREGVNRAFYSPTSDSITLPTKGEFNSLNGFYATAFHEMVHSTGHKDRLDRLTKGTRFGDTEYSKEELVAEIGSCILRAYLNVNDSNCDNNSISYLKGWYSYIKKEGGNVIVSAAQQSQKACDYILENVSNI
ncbi:hypothetical protein U729_3188 (plasmid) [Clostridium baratii str. Sullivan]|uniref:DNA primase TraC n=1 Tax=Clostridium baratii str. Sullivan TaxID=1415775 RepID=A0A0A7G016_9CLOT|nr:zincin-like metallopeptidase domain-containing protein [Clostridium baratii]AIY85219.1 hypothetical protein U729_3188 [Clostridium baratii str. Sullivan]